MLTFTYKRTCHCGSRATHLRDIIVKTNVFIMVLGLLPRPAFRQDADFKFEPRSELINNFAWKARLLKRVGAAPDHRTQGLLPVWHLTLPGNVT